MHEVLDCPDSVLGEGATPCLHYVVVQEGLIVVEGAGVRRHDVAQEGGAAPPGGGDQGPHRLAALSHHQAVQGLAMHGLKPGQVLGQESFLSGDGTSNFSRQGCLKLWKCSNKINMRLSSILYLIKAMINMQTMDTSCAAELLSSGPSAAGARAM